jgi:hypothetical protein
MAWSGTGENGSASTRTGSSTCSWWNTVWCGPTEWTPCLQPTATPSCGPLWWVPTHTHIHSRKRIFTFGFIGAGWWWGYVSVNIIVLWNVIPFVTKLIPLWKWRSVHVSGGAVYFSFNGTSFSWEDWEHMLTFCTFKVNLNVFLWLADALCQAYCPSRGKQ